MNYAFIIGILAAGLTTISFLPQAIKVIKTRNTSDLSLTMYLSFTAGVLLWLIYGFLINNIPIIVANFITLIFSSIILVMKIKHK